MTRQILSRAIGGPDDLNDVCSAVAAATARHGVDAEERARFTLAVARTLRERAAASPPARLTLTLAAAGDGDGGELTAEVVPGGPDGAPETVATIAVPDPSADSHGDAGDRDGLLELLAAQHERLAWHQQELERTDQGVLALHAELAQAAERLRAANAEQARLLDAEREARAAAESARSRLAFLAHAGATLSAWLDHEQVIKQLHSLVVPRHAAAMEVWISRDQRALTPSGALDEDAPGAAPPEAVVAAHDSGRTRHVTPSPSSLMPGVEVRPGPAELLAVPLISGGRALGVVAYTPAGHPFTADDIAVFRELTRLGAAALDNAIRYEHERGVAESLQRAMLTDLPSAAPLEFTARYLPAEAGLNVGGDWYDAFQRPDGQVIAAIGDVTGHGLRAATLMGQLRTALRAYALDSAGPGEVLARMHRLLTHLQPDDLATAVLLQYAGNGRLRWANAGHPPPLLRAPDGTVRVLYGGDVLLGMPLHDGPLTDREVELPPGATLLLYTDGLVERRTASFEATTDRLAEAFAAADVGGGLDRVADVLLDRMLIDSAREDDTCLLLCRARPVATDGDGPAMRTLVRSRASASDTRDRARTVP
ncbi:GAF domain-containing SpoIIE family protein phosphatase [Actinomadura miaoliensis]|uniref:SpoIIE family protein phosphatase n=1 Tax=Actinomadura miaoliensis TaxID=430685 RepID=A0ABP7V1Y8_9ACTN